MKATVKTPDGRVFTGELIEERKGFERVIDHIRISITQRNGFEPYPIRISILCGTNRGKREEQYGDCKNRIPGDILSEEKTKEVIHALIDALAYYRSNK